MRQNSKKTFQVVVLVVFFILIIGYGLFRSHDLIFGVKIKNVNITDGQTLDNNILKITGNAKNAVNISLNGREISVDQDGNWTETIALLPGYNIISIKALDKFGYRDEKDYKLIYTQ